MPGADPLAASEPRRERPFRVAAVQFNPELRVLDKNVDALFERFEEAARRGAKLIVAPEMATTGYLYRDREDITPFVEPIPGPATRRFTEIAKRYDCYLAWGMAEKDRATGLFYNSAAIVGPEGLLGSYRKTHLWESEAHWAAWGNLGIPVFETPYGNVALLVCQDANYEETFRLAMLGGADLVCFSTNSSGQTVGHLQARAIRNGLFVISANRSDAERDRRNGARFQMKGCSAIWSPTGRKLAEASLDGSETVYATIDPSLYRLKATWKQLRRPDLYVGIIRHISPWNEIASTESRQVEAVAVQYEPEPGDVAANLRKVESLLTERLKDSRRPASRLIVLPELSFVGPVPAEKTADYAESLNGPTTRHMVALAKRFHAHVVFGFPERSAHGLYNTAALIGPDGQLKGSVRKVHLNRLDKAWARPGRRFRVFPTDKLGRIGILVGSDAYVSEPGTILAIERADIVAVPSSWHGEIAGDGRIAINPEINPHAKRNAMVLWDDMAWTQFYYVVVANFVGTSQHYLGRSGIYSLDPIYGIESPGLAETCGEEVVVGAFHTLHGGEPDHWIDQQKYIASRRPDDLYYPLIRTRRARQSRPQPPVPAIAP